MEKMMEKGNKEIIMWPNYFLIIHSSFRMTINLLILIIYLIFIVK